MAAAKHQRARAVERVEQGETMRSGRGGQKRRQQQERREQRERNGTTQPADRKIQMSGSGRDVSLAEPKARAGAERDRRDLRQRSGEQYNDRNRGERDAGARTIRRESSRHAPDGL